MNDDRYTWAHCPGCGRKDSWRKNPIEADENECVACGYQTSDQIAVEPGPLPPLQSEPVTRLERIVIALIRATVNPVEFRPIDQAMPLVTYVQVAKDICDEMDRTHE